jgi:hypothetical protein
MRVFIFFIALLSSFVVPTASAATLSGSTVSAALYCCTAATEAYRISNIATDVVGSQIEFPANTFTFLGDGSSWSEGSIDVGPDTIQLDIFGSGTTKPGSFNGFIFSFSGAPAITGVTVDPTSALIPASLSYTSNRIIVDIASKPYTPGTAFVLNVALTPVPEPASVMLFAIGIIVLISLRRQNRDQ